jgi:hypothetical protein
LEARTTSCCSPRTRVAGVKIENIGEARRQASHYQRGSRLLKDSRILQRIVELRQAFKQVLEADYDVSMANSPARCSPRTHCWRRNRDPRQLDEPPPPSAPPGRDFNWRMQRGSRRPSAEVGPSGCRPSGLGKAPLQPAAPRPPAGVSSNTIGRAAVELTHGAASRVSAT